ncbi:uncharacterized protein LOC120069014 [Benincasa hispida]|uniref:uncharacterized protein LOC120069014 n=1 Tax=Benincasa hispida TaxID=102211 RepID=UPI001900E2C2|nr:uncharacterized protein LOC120069014 [Benincasa hispida]
MAACFCKIHNYVIFGIRVRSPFSLTNFNRIFQLRGLSPFRLTPSNSNQSPDLVLTSLPHRANDPKPPSPCLIFSVWLQGSTPSTSNASWSLQPRRLFSLFRLQMINQSPSFTFSLCFPPAVGCFQCGFCSAPPVSASAIIAVLVVRINQFYRLGKGQELTSEGQMKLVIEPYGDNR